ncbi:MAG: protein FdrA, partial [Actinomycetota bacterium]
SATRAMQQSPGVRWAAALMGTPANVEGLIEQGFERATIGRAEANDLVLAARADTPEHAESALDTALEALIEKAPAGEGRRERRPRTMEEARRDLKEANVALISVPGAFAGLEAQKALSAGLHVLLFSDNVPLETEVALKRRAAEAGLLLMGPGAGTAMLGGAGLGFANAVRRGPVGIVAAAGTGAQEAMSLLYRWGTGVSQVIGVGGRDLSETVGAKMARRACEALEADPGTEVILLVSKPPSETVARSLLAQLRGKPAVACFVGLDAKTDLPAKVTVARTIERACARAMEILGIVPAGSSPGLAPVVREAIARLGPERSAVRGLYSGGTLCYEAMTVMAPRLGAIHSNTPLRPEWGLPPPPGAHACLDLGEEEFTRGRPHPMIDPEPRAERIAEEAATPETAVLLIDVVLGYGAHPDPASVLAPACARAAARPGGPAVVAYVLGTDRDSQDCEAQRRRMREAGCILAPTSARAALMAAAIAARQPSIAEETS